MLARFFEALESTDGFQPGFALHLSIEEPGISDLIPVVSKEHPDAHHCDSTKMGRLVPCRSHDFPRDCPRVCHSALNGPGRRIQEARAGVLAWFRIGQLLAHKDRSRHRTRTRCSRSGIIRDTT